MLSLQMLDELAQKLADSVPQNLQKVPEDIQRNFQSILQGTFSKLNLVPADEFEVQTKVLARTREKVEQLTKQVTELEKMLNEKNK